MPSVTGIEVAERSCALVRVRRRGNTIELSAANVIDESQWARDDRTRTDLLRRTRRQQRLPRRARIVVWGAHESASLADPATRALVRSIAAAGFRVEAVFTPPQALARLAADRPRCVDTATAWLALNRGAAALAVVRGSDLLFSRILEWTYRTAARPQDDLLQRYSLVAHLAPEIRRAMQAVRAGYAAPVDAVVTCGNLPDLRSVTMPLIEELDIEVETLDSTDGLQLGGARPERLADAAPSLRIACAAAAAPLPRLTMNTMWRVPAAAALVAFALLGWWGYSGYTSGPQPRQSAKSAAPAPVRDRPSVETAAATQHPGRTAGNPPPRTPPPSDPAAAVADTRNPPPKAPPAPSEREVAPPLREVRGPVIGASSRITDTPRSMVDVQAGGPLVSRGTPILPVPPLRSRERSWAMDPAAALRSPGRPAAAPLRATVPLTDPLPAVSSILVSADRRLAVLDGAIVGEGDPVGRRVLVRIEPSAVVLREPSGHEVRVAIRRFS